MILQIEYLIKIQGTMIKHYPEMLAENNTSIKIGVS